MDKYYMQLITTLAVNADNNKLSDYDFRKLVINSTSEFRVPKESQLETIDLQQVIYALGRAERRLQAEADALHGDGDYSAEMPAEDAERMREAIVLLRQMMTPNFEANRAATND